MQSARSSKSFIEVLEDEIRADIRREVESELATRFATAAPAGAAAPSAALHAAGRLETWLASHIGPITFKSPRSAYGATASRSSAARAPHAPAPHAPAPRGPGAARAVPAAEAPRFTALTSADAIAYELLNRAAALPTSFTADELKSAWRKAALKTHPDRFVGQDLITITRMTAAFRELAQAYEQLHALTEAPLSAAPAAVA